MNDMGSTHTPPLIFLVLCPFVISGCSQADSIPAHSPVAPASTIEPTPMPEVLTATGLTPQQNVDRYGIPGEIAPFAYAVPKLHNRTGEDNADAHLKRQVIGREVVVAVTNGRLNHGTWERIFFGPGGMAGLGVSTAVGGSGCWQRLSGSSDR